MEADDPQAKKEMNQLIMHLTRYNILPLNSTLDDVLALDIESILARRLQTIAYLKGFANTPRQARQLICHGHIAIDGRRITVPGYRLTKDEEGKIDYAMDSPLTDAAHPARPSGEFKSKLTVTASEDQQGKEPEKPVVPPTKQPTPNKKQVPPQKEKQPAPQQPPKEPVEVKKTPDAPVQSTEPEKKPAEVKPTEAKPTEVKPTETEKTPDAPVQPTEPEKKQASEEKTAKEPEKPKQPEKKEEPAKGGE